MTERQTVALIIPYYGNIPDYFDLWAESAGKNLNFDFFLFSDLDFQVSQYKNIHLINLSFPKLCSKFKQVLGNDIILNQPYKLCDYRPTYGLVFSEYIKDYDFWGFCDIDLIFGNIGHFITSEVLSKYNKILTQGHFCLMKNDDKMNNLFMEKYKNVRDYQSVFHTRDSCHFDEGGTIAFADEYDTSIKLFFDWIYFDVDYNSYQIFRAEKELCFVWNNGKLLGYSDNEDDVQEYMYIHLQKRKMFRNFEGVRDRYYILRDEFIADENLDVCSCLSFPVDSRKKKSFQKSIKRKLIKLKISAVKKGRIKQIIIRRKNHFRIERKYPVTKENREII